MSWGIKYVKGAAVNMLICEVRDSMSIDACPTVIIKIGQKRLFPRYVSEIELVIELGSHHLDHYRHFFMKLSRTINFQTWEICLSRLNINDISKTMFSVKLLSFPRTSSSLVWKKSKFCICEFRVDYFC